MTTFAQRLHHAIDSFGPICVGVDPSPALLDQWNLSDDAGGLASFTDIILDAFSGRVCAFKPQVAFFERHGSAGVAVLERFQQAAREAGTLVIADAKRGDIGSTMAGYAEAFLGDGPLAADAVTLSPYLGVGALRPAFEVAQANGRGAFVLCLTSNPEGFDLQRDISAVVAREVGEVNTELWPGERGSVGLVIGATVGNALESNGVNIAGMGGPVLAPGVGAQGATLADVYNTIGQNVDIVIPISRGLLTIGPDPDQLFMTFASLYRRLP